MFFWMAQGVDVSSMVVAAGIVLPPGCEASLMASAFSDKAIRQLPTQAKLHAMWCLLDMYIDTIQFQFQLYIIYI